MPGRVVFSLPGDQSYPSRITQYRRIGGDLEFMTVRTSRKAGPGRSWSREFERIGKRLFAEHLVGGNFGNISVRSANGFFIKRTGAYLDVAGEPVFVPLDGPAPAEASSEYRVHREIYRHTLHQAIVHAHPPSAIAASLLLDTITPEDSEGVMFCPEIPVVTGDPGTQEVADNVAAAMVRAKLVIARGHGTFSAGKNLDEAYLLTSLAEHSCRVLAIKKHFSSR